MSLADDEDFVSKFVEKTERFVASELGKVIKEMTALKAKQTESQCKIANLQKENEDLKAENARMKARLDGLTGELENLRKHSDVKALKTLEDSFRAGLITVLEASKDIDMDITPVLQAMDIPMATSTLAHTDVPNQEFASPVIGNRLSLHSRKRKNTASAAPGTITNLDDLPSKIKNYISPFYHADAQANKDKLYNVQGAFVKAKANDLVTTKSPINTAYVSQVIAEGEEEHIWPSDFSPSTDLDFDKYIFNRLKNERKALVRKLALASQEERMMGYIDETLSISSQTIDEGDE